MLDPELQLHAKVPPHGCSHTGWTHLDQNGEVDHQCLHVADDKADDIASNSCGSHVHVHLQGGEEGEQVERQTGEKRP